MLAAIRIRGRVNIRGEVEDNLAMLKLNRISHCVLLPEKPEYLGMLKKGKDWITWGKIDKKTIVELFKRRGMLTQRRKLDEKNLEKATKYVSIESFVEDLMKGKINLKDYPEIKPVFRLNPPLKGFKSTRLPYPKGDLGDRKDKIDELLKRMM